MARKKSHQGMHIKRNTAGSSNEISFSVLDAAKEALGEDRHDQGGTGGISLFTLGKKGKPRSTPAKDQHIVLSGDAAKHSRSRSASPSSGERHAAAQARTARRTIPVIVGICVVLVLALVGLQTWLQMVDRQKSLRSQLDGQLELLAAADEVVIPLDDLVMKLVDANFFSEEAQADPQLSQEALAETYRTVVADIAPARTELEGMVASIEDIEPSLTDNRDEEAAAQAIIAAQSRLNMLDAGVKIIDEALMATESYEAAEDGWTRVIDGDAAVREATDLAKDMTKDNVQASMAKTQESIVAFGEAEALFDHAVSAYPGLDLQSVEEYLAKRQEAQAVALELDQAYLDRDKTALKKKSSQYNTLEDEAASLAQTLGERPENIVVQKYRSAVADEKEAYDAERLKAGNADTFLRDYLGTTPE